MTDAYDSDDSCNRSDRLEAQIINYKLEDTLPPFVHRRSPSDGGPHGSSPAKGTPSRRSRKHRKVQPTAADAVLISHIDPNRPDIANYAKEHPLLDWSSADDLDIPPKLKAKKAEAEPAESLPASTDLEREAREALSLIPDESQVEHGGSGPSLIGLGDKVQSPRQDRKDHDPSPLAPVEPVSRTEPTLQNHVHQLPRLSTSSERWISDNIRDTSPLRKYAIPPSERPVQEWLPAPQPASANSPGNSFNLPSLQSALGEQLSGIPPPKDHSGRIGGASTYVFPPVPGSSPPLPRKDLVRERQLSGPLPPPQIPLSPYSHFSPASSNDISNVPSPASQLPSWRPTLKADIRYVTSNFDVSPHASQTAKSPATAYPTPIDQTPAVSEGVPLPTNSTSQSNNVPTSAGTYRCRHPGCTAPPFQTQYLLK